MWERYQARATGVCIPGAGKGPSQGPSAWKCFRDTEGQRKITKETEGGRGAGRVSVGAELTGTYCTTVSTTLSVTPFRASDRDMALPLVETALAGVRPSILPAVPSTAAGAHVTAEMVPWTAFCRV